MNLLNEIKKWPQKKKQNFSLLMAFFLTLIILSFSILVNQLFKEEKKITSKYNYLNRMSDSFLKIFKDAGSEADIIFQESLDKLEQTNPPSSSSSINLNIVE